MLFYILYYSFIGTLTMHPLIKVLLDALLGELKDAKTLLLRVIAITFACMLYYFFTSGPVLVDLVKSMNYTNFLQEQKQIQASQFKTRSLYSAQSLYALSGAEIVAIIEFQPENINERQVIIAQSGKKQLGAEEFPVNKASQAYMQLLSANGVLLISSDLKKDRWSNNCLYPPDELDNIGVSVTYLFPIFNINAVLSGYIMIGWASPPFAIESQEGAEHILRDFVITQAIQLGRTK